MKDDFLKIAVIGLIAVNLYVIYKLNETDNIITPITDKLESLFNKLGL
jgi:hypothetical protein